MPGVTVDRDCMTVTVDGRRLKLTRRTWLFCDYMSRHPGFVRTKEQIMDACGVSCGKADLTAIDIVRRARQQGVPCIETRHGLGYCWRDD